ncbi:MAG: hypothetical protein U5K51_12895 [Flavobacteriaceae bacterium]|nr:hypothetical protein [Flavobacteriaceae bacterium]
MFLLLKEPSWNVIFVRTCFVRGISQLRLKSCPMGVIYFGDKNEDMVTNGEETVRFSTLINDRGGYRHLEHVGTKPNVILFATSKQTIPACTWI